MALFPKEDVKPHEEAARRRAITHENGTRRLVVGFIALIAIWLIGNRVRDHFLLQKHWAAVPVEESGLTVVATLDKRGDYDRNLFRIVQVEGEARAEVTNFGWASIFDGRHGPLTSDLVGNTIQGAITLDSDTGYAMLQPFLAAEVRTEMGDKSAFDGVTGDYPVPTTVAITPQERKQKHVARRNKTLRELVDYYQQAARDRKDNSGETEGGTGSEHQVEHGLVVPGQTLIHSCPVILNSRHFTSGFVEEHPELVMGGKTYSVWLSLTPEGRSRFYQWSRDHANEHLLLVLNGQVAANGRMAMTMDTDRWEITNLKDGDAARKLVAYINAHHL